MKLQKTDSILPQIKGEGSESAVQFELEIQRQRILYILHFTIKKMEIMAALPKLLKNRCKLLRPFLSETDIAFIITSCNRYFVSENINYEPHVSSEKFTLLLDKISLNQYDEDDLPLAKSLLSSLVQNERVDYHISQVINMIISCEPLTAWLEAHPVEFEEAVYNIINCMRHLKHLVHEKLLITSKQQEENVKKLKKAYKSNYMVSQSITRLNEQLEKQNSELGAELNKRYAILAAYENELEEVKDCFRIEMYKRVDDSEKKMMEYSFSSEDKQAELQIEAKEVTAKYDSVTQSNLMDEALLRSRRNRIESQLFSWLAKYDNDMGERQAELENVETQIADLKDEYNNLMEKFEEQAVEYDILMKEKAKEEARLFEIMAMEFLRNRAARKIQNYWKEYEERKILRRKTRKAKRKGKKSAGRRGGSKKGGRKAKKTKGKSKKAARRGRGSKKGGSKRGRTKERGSKKGRTKSKKKGAGGFKKRTKGKRAKEHSEKNMRDNDPDVALGDTPEKKDDLLDDFKADAEFTAIDVKVNPDD